jgi:hypothetical protein
MDNNGARLNRWELVHCEAGLVRTLSRPLHHSDSPDMPVAMGTNCGLVVDRLPAAGRPAVPVRPKAFDKMCARWDALKSKTDAADSFKHTDYLHSDSHLLLLRLEPTNQITLGLQALTRQRADHLEARIAAVNQLAARLDAPRH